MMKATEEMINSVNELMNCVMKNSFKSYGDDLLECMSNVSPEELEMFKLSKKLMDTTTEYMLSYAKQIDRIETLEKEILQLLESKKEEESK